jgi:hypothetical protein
LDADPADRTFPLLEDNASEAGQARDKASSSSGKRTKWELNSRILKDALFSESEVKKCACLRNATFYKTSRLILAPN